MYKSLINMERPNTLYVAGIGALMVLSLVLSNLPGVSLSQFFEIPYKRELGAGLFILGASLGAWAVHRQMLRTRMPWRVPQSQVSIPYVGSLACSVLALLVTH